MVNWVVVEGDWKLVYREEPKDYEVYQIGRDGLVQDDLLIETIPSGIQLYHLVDDPGEETNLAAEYPERVETMQKFYEDWRSQMGDPVSGKKVR